MMRPENTFMGFAVTLLAASITRDPGWMILACYVWGFVASVNLGRSFGDWLDR